MGSIFKRKVKQTSEVPSKKNKVFDVRTLYEYIDCITQIRVIDFGYWYKDFTYLIYVFVIPKSLN